MTPRTMTAEQEYMMRRTHPRSGNHVADAFAELDAEREAHDATKRVSKALAEVLQREVDWASRATSPCARMPEYEHARIALAQYAASFPEKEINLEPR